MKYKILLGLLLIIVLVGCDTEPDGTEISESYPIPTRITSVVIEPQFEGIFYANVSCRGEYEFTENTTLLDLWGIERQEFSQEFLEIIDSRIVLQLEKEIDKGDYIEFRRYYLPEFRTSFYEKEFERKINLSGYEAYCKTYDYFNFDYKYYDGEILIKEGEYRCAYYDFRFNCGKNFPEDDWDCDEEFDYWETENHIYDCVMRFLEEK